MKLTKNVVSILPKLPKTPPWGKSIRFSILFGISVTVLINIFFIVKGNYGFFLNTEDVTVPAYYSLLHYFSLFGQIAIVIGSYYWYLGAPLKNYDKLFIVICVSLLIAFGLLYGMKAHVLRVLIMFLIPYIILGIYKIRKKNISKVYLILLPILFLIFWILNPLYRGELKFYSSTKNILSVPRSFYVGTKTGIKKNIYAMYGEAPLKIASQNIWSRVSLFHYFSAVVSQTPSIYNYRNWDRYKYLPFSPFIPRVLWPSKPRNDQASIFNVRYISDIWNSTTPTTFGWAYLEYGIISIMMLMFLLGLVANVIQSYTINTTLSLSSIILFTMLFNSLFNLEADPYWIISGIPKTIITVVIAYWLLIKLPGELIWENT
ncbi:MAG: hypothetical protein IIA61_02990 [Candidatus Marinimicrobia bacterium]|nr:hypothetical protein [Candidatus Neomarinimicrobiota bacterium]